MRVMDRRTEEILVTRDTVGRSVELHVAGATADEARTIRLTRAEARHLAALILFQASRLDRSASSWIVPSFETERRSA